MWRDVVGYEGLYEISPEGAVRTVARVSKAGHRCYTVQQKIVTPRTSRNGWRYVKLYKQGEQRDVGIKNLVKQYASGLCSVAGSGDAGS